MRYQNSVKVILCSETIKQTKKVDRKVYDNLVVFMKDKHKSEKLFDKLTVMKLNSHLKEFMDGLSAKAQKFIV